MGDFERARNGLAVPPITDSGQLRPAGPRLQIDPCRTVCIEEKLAEIEVLECWRTPQQHTNLQIPCGPAAESNDQPGLKR